MVIKHYDFVSQMTYWPHMKSIKETNQTSHVPEASHHDTFAVWNNCASFYKLSGGIGH